MDQTLFWLAILSGGFMAWAVGANDVANAMGTSVGSKVITIKQAIFIAAVFEGLGALLSSGSVTGTIRHDIIDIDFFVNDGLMLAKGMIASLLASATWLILATKKGWPVSTTHSIIGAVIGFGLVTQGPANIHWENVSDIAISWAITPLVSASISWFCFKLIQRFILSYANPFSRTCVFFSLVIGVCVFLASLGASLYVFGRYEYLLALSVSLSTILSVYYLSFAKSDVILNYRDQSEKSEKLFGILALFSACAMAYAHGANDVANAIGPMASVVDILKYGYIREEAIPMWLLITGSAGVVLGLAMYGYKIISSVGSKITVLSPSRSFSAQLATSVVVLIASYLGFPVSTTHTLVGAVLGVGLARGIAAVNLSVVGEIFMSWGVTIPAGGIFSISYFTLLRYFL